MNIFSRYEDHRILYLSLQDSSGGLGSLNFNPIVTGLLLVPKENPDNKNISGICSWYDIGAQYLRTVEIIGTPTITDKKTLVKFSNGQIHKFEYLDKSIYDSKIKQITSSNSLPDLGSDEDVQEYFSQNP